MMHKEQKLSAQSIIVYTCLLAVHNKNIYRKYVVNESMFFP